MVQRQYFLFGTGWICKLKFTFLNFVLVAKPWRALLFSATKIGVVQRISCSKFRSLGIFHGRFIVPSRLPCKGLANGKPPGFSFVIKTM